MPAFITLSLILSYLVQTESPYQHIFTATITTHLGLACITISIISVIIKKSLYTVCYDLFATGALLTWFSNWHQFFRNDVPMFYLFPLYFAFLTALVSLLFISKRDRFDQESVDHIRYFNEMTRFHPGLVVSGVLISMLLPEHYLLFPVAMSLFIVRYTFTRCADIK